MTFSGFSDDALTFYEGLVADNSKTYWTEHKQIYEHAVREPMRALLDELAPKFDGEPVLFRPYRDVRFSKDKSPYKTQQGAFLEVASSVGYYLQLDAEGVLIGGGFHAPSRDYTARYRAAVDDPDSGEQLDAILRKLKEYEVGGEQVRTRPRGVLADHPRLDLMRREFLTVGRQLPIEAVTSAVLTAEWTKMRPLIEWTRRHVVADD